MDLVDPDTGEKVSLQTIALDRLKNGPDVRKDRISYSHVDRLKHGIDDLPPITVRKVGDRFEVIDGHHRVKAHLDSGRESIVAKVVHLDDVETLMEAIRANTTHGLHLEHSERRLVAKRLLTMSADLSDRAVSAACGLDDKTVAVIRSKCPTAESPQLDTGRRKGLDGRSRPTPERASEIRDAIRREAANNPTASDRDLARSTGASPSTVGKHRNSHLSSVPDVWPETTVADLVTVLPNKWADESACKRSDQGMKFGRFMDRRQVRELEGEVPSALALDCPMELLEAAISSAKVQATNWRRMADALEQRKPRLEGAS